MPTFPGEYVHIVLASSRANLTAKLSAGYQYCQKCKTTNQKNRADTDSGSLASVQRAENLPCIECGIFPNIVQKIYTSFENRQILIGQLTEFSSCCAELFLLCLDFLKLS